MHSMCSFTIPVATGLGDYIPHEGWDASHSLLAAGGALEDHAPDEYDLMGHENFNWNDEAGN